MKQDELNVILENHLHWLNEDCVGWESMRADLQGADLCRADLYRANLYRANLREADLRGADLRGTINFPFIPLACPDTGSFIGYKKADNKIIKLEILEDSKRSSATTRKCRCDKARVISIEKIDGTESGLKSVPSDRDKDFIYEVGRIVSVDDFDDDRWNECSTGIHFFINHVTAVIFSCKYTCTFKIFKR